MISNLSKLMSPLKSWGTCAVLLGVMLGGCASQSQPGTATNPGSSLLSTPPTQSSRIEHAHAWNRRLTTAVLPNIDYPATASQPPRSAEFTVFMDSEGTITDKSLLSTSGNPDWDRAASLALRKTLRLPADQNGHTPYQAVIGIGPTLVTGAVIQRKLEPSAAPSSTHSASSYGARIAAAVRPNIVVANPDEIPGNPGAEFDIALASTGEIVSIVLTKSSGWLDWDAAALRGLQKTERLPQDIDGKVPKRLIVTLRPKR